MAQERVFTGELLTEGQREFQGRENEDLAKRQPNLTCIRVSTK